MRFSLRNTGLWLAATIAVAVAVRTGRAADVWKGQPYHIQLSLAIDAPGGLAEQLAAELPQYLNDRTISTIGSVWRLKTDVASGELRYKLLGGLDALQDDDVAGADPKQDKQLFVTVRATPWGYELSAREFDQYVQRWGVTLHRRFRQRDVLDEQVFDLVRQAVAPLARIRPNPKDPQQVTLELRGRNCR